MLSHSDLLNSEPKNDRRKRTGEVILASVSGIDSSVWELAIRDCGLREGDIELFEELSAASADRNVFFDPPFFAASHERLGLQIKKLITLSERVGDTKTLKLVFPVQQETVGFPEINVLRVWSHEYGPLSAPLVDNEDTDEIGRVFVRALSMVGGNKWNALVFQDIPTNNRFARSVRDHSATSNSVVMNGYYQRALIKPRSADDYPESVLKPKRVKELARQWRRLEELGELKLDVASGFMDCLLRFEEFLLLETQSWKGDNGTSMHMIRKTAAFARQAIANLVEADACRLYSLRLNDRAIASVIVLRSGNWYFPWKMAFDEAYSKYSVGKILIKEMTKDMLALKDFEGADSLAGPSNAMINQLWPDRVELGNLVFGMGKNADANAKTVAARLNRKSRLKSYAKYLLKR